jgi:rubrerythrin
MDERDAEAAPSTPEAHRSPEPAGGEPACLLDRVCDACGRMADAAPPTTCPRCGARIGD